MSAARCSASEVTVPQAFEVGPAGAGTRLGEDVREAEREEGREPVFGTAVFRLWSVSTREIVVPFFFDRDLRDVLGVVGVFASATLISSIFLADNLASSS